MSFALDYRKSQASLGVTYTEQGSARTPGAAKASRRAMGDKRLHRLSVLGALLIAAGVLGTFNSAALVQYSYGLSQSSLGVRVLELSERWHDFMERQHMTAVVARIRDAVAVARQSTWQDLALGLNRTAGTDDDRDPAADASADEPPASSAAPDARASIEPYISAANPTSP